MGHLVTTWGAGADAGEGALLCISWVLRLGVGFPGGSDGKESACSGGDLGSIPGLGRFPWRRAWQTTSVFLPGKIPMDRGGWQATVHGVAKSRTQLGH